MRHLFKLFAPVYFWLAYSALRSGWFAVAGGQNQWIMKLLRLAADFRHRRALSVYGHLLHLHGDNQQSKIQGGIYLQRAADMGDMKAQYLVGRLFENGFAHYFPINEERARSYYQQAAEQGHAVAISRLVDAYEAGELGLSPDQTQAERWQQRLPG